MIGGPSTNLARESPELGRKRFRSRHSLAVSGKYQPSRAANLGKVLMKYKRYVVNVDRSIISEGPSPWNRNEAKLPFAAVHQESHHSLYASLALTRPCEECRNCCDRGCRGGSPCDVGRFKAAREIDAGRRTLAMLKDKDEERDEKRKSTVASGAGGLNVVPAMSELSSGLICFSCAWEVLGGGYLSP